MRAKLPTLAVLVSLVLPAMAIAGPGTASSRTRYGELGASIRFAIGALPEGLVSPANRFMEDFDAESFSNLNEKVEASLTGSAAEDANPRGPDGNWGGVDERYLTLEREKQDAAERIELLYIALKRVLTKPGNEDALKRFVAVRETAIRKLREPGAFMATVRSRIEGFSSGKISDRLDQDITVVLLSPDSGATPIKSALAKPRAPKKQDSDYVHPGNVPPPSVWEATRFPTEVKGDRWIYEHSRGRAEASALVKIVDMLSRPEDTVAGVPSLSDDQAQGFLHPFRNNSIRGSEGSRYVVLDAHFADAVVNHDPKTVLILGDKFSAPQGVYSAGRIFLAGAHTESLIVSNEAVVILAGTHPDGKVQAPSIFMQHGVKPGRNAVLLSSSPLGAF